MLAHPRVSYAPKPAAGGCPLQTLSRKHSTKPRQALARATHRQQASEVGLGPLHALLGLEEGCSEDFARYYRRLVATLHPDVNRSKLATRKFQAVTQAYQILKTPELRARFERQGLRSLGPRFALLRQYLHDHMLADVGLGRRGGDLYTVVGLDLREASTGVETVVTVSAQGTCAQCKGSGVAAQQSEDCDVCHGSGDILRTRYSQTGFKALHVGACPACGGGGAKAKVLCGCCLGEGRTSMRKRVHVKVPAGMDESRVLRLKGLGNAGVAGGPSGDLVMRFQIHATPNLERRGHDLHSRLEICCTSAVLGAEVPVSSVRGLRFLDVPQGTQDGAVICLPGCGLAYAEQGLVRHGSHFFTVSLVIPDGGSMGPGALELLAQLQQLSNSAAAQPRQAAHAQGAEGLTEYHEGRSLEQQQQLKQEREAQRGQEPGQQGGESAPRAEQQQAHQTSHTDAHAQQQQQQQQEGEIKREARRLAYQQRRERHMRNAQCEGQGQDTASRVQGAQGSEQNAGGGEQVRGRETQGGGVHQSEAHTAHVGGAQAAGHEHEGHERGVGAQGGEWLQCASWAQGDARSQHSQCGSQPLAHESGQGGVGRGRVWVQGREGLWLNHPTNFDEGQGGSLDVPLPGSESAAEGTQWDGQQGGHGCWDGQPKTDDPWGFVGSSSSGGSSSSSSSSSSSRRGREGRASPQAVA